MLVCFGQGFLGDFFEVFEMSSGKGFGIFLGSYGFIGLIVAVLDAFKIAKLGLLTMSGVACAQSSAALTCIPDAITSLVYFFIDIVVGPFLLLYAIITNLDQILFFGFILLICLVGVLFLFFIFGNKNENMIC